MTHVAGRLAALDAGEDRLQQRADIALGFAVAPELGRVVCRAHLQQPRLLALCNIDRLPEESFRTLPVRLRVPERKLPLEPMQIGEPVTPTGLPGVIEGI